MIRATLPVVLVIALAVTAGVLLAQYQAPSAADSAAGQLAAASSHGSGGCCSKAKAGETTNVSLAARNAESQAAGRASGGCPFAAATEKECSAVKAECSATTKECSETQKECSTKTGCSETQKECSANTECSGTQKECSAEQSACSAKTECSGGKAASCLAAAKCSNREKCPSRSAAVRMRKSNLPRTANNWRRVFRADSIRQPQGAALYGVHAFRVAIIPRNDPRRA